MYAHFTYMRIRRAYLRAREIQPMYLARKSSINKLIIRENRDAEA